MRWMSSNFVRFQKYLNHFSFLSWKKEVLFLKKYFLSQEWTGFNIKTTSFVYWLNFQWRFWGNHLFSSKYFASSGSWCHISSLREPSKLMQNQVMRQGSDPLIFKRVVVMVIWVVAFSRGVHKVRKFFVQKSTFERLQIGFIDNKGI